MNRARLWLSCVLLSFIQLVYGNFMTLYDLTNSWFIPHIFIAILILALNIVGVFQAKGNERRTAIGNLGLILITIAIGGYLYSFFNAVLVMIHFIIGLGILSNFIILYSMVIYKRTE